MACTVVSQWADKQANDRPTYTVSKPVTLERLDVLGVHWEGVS
jgi:hypothetical protein